MKPERLTKERLRNLEELKKQNPELHNKYKQIIKCQNKLKK